MYIIKFVFYQFRKINFNVNKFKRIWLRFISKLRSNFVYFNCLEQVIEINIYKYLNKIYVMRYSVIFFFLICIVGYLVYNGIDKKYLNYLKVFKFI